MTKTKRADEVYVNRFQAAETLLKRWPADMPLATLFAEYEKRPHVSGATFVALHLLVELVEKRVLDDSDFVFEARRVVAEVLSGKGVSK
jgi:hypothetical protein